jgi:hypothetical protein
VGFDYINDEIVWIFKNSWGFNSGWGEAGYCTEALLLSYPSPPLPYNSAFIMDTVHAFNYTCTDPPPITVNCNLPENCNPNFSYYVHNNDFDKDGYHNWGIGPRPDNSYLCGSYVENEEMEDSNDDDNRIGPYEDDYSGRPIKPVMYVLQGDGFGISVADGELISIIESNAQDVIKTFTIGNSGTAQLNLEKDAMNHGKVTIDYQNNGIQFSISEPCDTSICMNHFTTFNITIQHNAPNGSLAHIHIYLDEPPDIDPIFEFTLVFNGCETVTGSYDINGIVNWNEPYKFVNRDVKINRDGVLTITGHVIFTNESDICVAPGGKLVIDGGKLTGSCNSLWNGIDIWGSTSLPQTIDYQGMVEIKNGGIIEFADTAIATVRNNGIDKIPTGGIIYCKDAIFKDNYVGVCLPGYQSPGGQPNVSRFKRTEFKITDDYYSLDNLVRTAPKCGFQLAAQIGVYMEGCSFTNESRTEKRRRGSGIINMDAGCYVKSACLVDDQEPCQEFVPSRFEGLDYGIKTSNIYSSRTFSVESADFIDNYRGVYMSLTNDATIIKNHFDLNADDPYFQPGDTLVGIYSERCDRYLIEENVINGIDPNQFNLVGMHILNSGPRGNEIYNNSLNHLLSGIIAAGENCEEGGPGLCIKCNDFAECDFDIFVTSQGGNNAKYFGIATSQGEEATSGDPTYAAGNTFSVESESNPNYANEENCNPIIYTHHGNNSSGRKIIPNPIEPPLPSLQISLNPDDGVDYSEKDTVCPSHLIGGININTEKNQLIVETFSQLDIEGTLAALIDGGKTDELNFDIQTSFPDEALLLRHELLDNSPYLSDTVMKSAIYKDDVMPNAMIRDILTANPQSAKSGDILEAVVNRIDPMPDYMLTEILQGQNVYGAKEIMEQHLSYHKSQRDKLLSKIFKYYKADTNNIQVSLDSMISVMQNEIYLSAAYELSFLYLERSDSTNIFGVLSNIPSKFNLSESEIDVFSQYSTLLDLLWEIHADTTGLDSLQIETLLSLSQINNSIPGVYSRNVLVNENLIDFQENVFLPEFVLKSSIASNTELPKTIKNSMLKVFPNPSGNYFIVEYDLEKPTTPAMIKLSDLNGKTLNSWQLNDNRNQFIVSTEEYGSGIYNLKLFVGNSLKEAVKLIIKR